MAAIAVLETGVQKSFGMISVIPNVLTVDACELWFVSLH